MQALLHVVTERCHVIQNENTPEGKLAISAPCIDALQINDPSLISSLGDHGCLLKIKVVWLSYREVPMASGAYPSAVKNSLVLCSVSARMVVDVGLEVMWLKRLRQGLHHILPAF